MCAVILDHDKEYTIKFTLKSKVPVHCPEPEQLRTRRGGGWVGESLRVGQSGKKRDIFKAWMNVSCFICIKLTKPRKYCCNH